jgi:hypothetical protein
MDWDAYIWERMTPELLKRIEQRRLAEQWEDDKVQRVTLRERCGARTRQGGQCQAKVVKGKNRCRLHGGLSTGPKTAQGKARIIKSNRKRAQTYGNASVNEFVRLSREQAKATGRSAAFVMWNKLARDAKNHAKEA